MRGWEIQGRVSIVLQRIKNVVQELDQKVIHDDICMEAEVYETQKRLPLREAIDLPRTPIQEKDHWGEAWSSAYFLLKAQVKPEWEHKELAVRLSFGAEALIYDNTGNPCYSLTDYSAFDHMYQKQLYHLGTFEANAPVVLYVEAAANGLFGVHKPAVIFDRSQENRHGTWDAQVHLLRLGVFDQMRWSLLLDMQYALDLYEHLQASSVRAVRLLGALFSATVAYQKGEIEEARASLAKELNKNACPSSLCTTVIGHAHIDTAWLWPIAETRRKIARTYASQLSLLETYPQYIFGASAPQHYAWIKEDHPNLYETIKAAVDQGRWELQGGMWIEPDCNLVSGESLVRQILYGKQFFLEEFGIEVQTCWIPDVFGYPASLPQILKKSGLPYFLTQKMSWSKHNTFMYDSFLWQGIDGSSVIAHFLPEHDYNSSGKPGSLIKAEHNFHEKDRLDEFITLLGIGDGGGGPKEEHIEFILRSSDTESVPKASFGTSEAFFRRLEQQKSLLETYRGELYLEYHRGTYTSQARVKKYNRMFEEQVRQVQALYSYLPLQRYPHRELEEIIKQGLTLQFHDILPGSSIHAVYEDAHRIYQEMLEKLESLQEKARSLLFTQKENSLVVFNPLNAGNRFLVELPSFCAHRSLVADNQLVYETQILHDRQNKPHVYADLLLPNQGLVELDVVPMSQETPCNKTKDALVLSNDEVCYRFLANGQLIEAFDVASGESLMDTHGSSNNLQWYDDTPHTYEAWDIDYYYPQQVIGTIEAHTYERIADGPVLSALRFHYAFGSSSMVQDVLLSSTGKALIFKNHIDWQETRKLLRVTFYVDQLSERAICDIPYGLVERPAKVQHEWDFAKFEFCARQFVDVYHDGRGIALINDCKYGYSCRDGVLGMSLLRSPLNPDPDADIGMHDFSYVFLPHTQSLEYSDVKRVSALLNCPALVFAHSSIPKGQQSRLPLYMEGSGCSVEALGCTIDQKALMIRIVELYGKSSQVTLNSDNVPNQVVETDLLEQPLREAVPQDLPLTVKLKPFEIKTFRLAETY
jgi:alpha-mannosidase